MAEEKDNAVVFGYLAQGNNVEVKEMTINEAMVYSIKLGPNCIGFTCYAEADYNKKVNIWFKDTKCSPDVHKSTEWQTYLKPNLADQEVTFK